MTAATARRSACGATAARDLVGRREDGGHGAAGRQRLHQPAALGDQAQAVLER